MNTSNVQLIQEAPPAGLSNRLYRENRKRNRIEVAPPTNAVSDETLVIDDRAHVSPAQAIESKLTRLLEQAWVPVSHLQTRGLLKAR